MGRLTEEMTRLREDVDNLSRERKSFINSLGKDVAELKSDTVKMQARFRDDHQRMAETEKKKRVTFLNGLSTNVSDMQAGFRQERKENAAKSVKELNAFMSDIRTFVSDLGQTVSQTQETFREDFAKSSKKNKEKRTAFLTNLKKDVETLQQTFNQERFAAAQKMKGDFARTAKERKQFVSDLGLTVSQMQSEFRESLEEMTMASRKERQGFIAGVVQSVADLQEQGAQFRKAFADDFAGARAIWSSKKKIGGSVPVTPAPPLSEESEETPPLSSQPEKKANTAPAVDMKKKNDIETEKEGKFKKKTDINVKKKDDLTYITGIGPGRLKQLNASGIFTFKQLGDLTQEALRELLGESSRLVDVKNWIEQARDFS